MCFRVPGMPHRQLESRNVLRKRKSKFSRRCISIGPSKKISWRTHCIPIVTNPCQEPSVISSTQEMGLGKTVEILALILANPHPNPPQLEPPGPIRQPNPPIPAGGVPSKATLVVCAVSLVGQWISEAKGKLSAPTNMYKYHGQGRSNDPFFLARQDIVSVLHPPSVHSTFASWLQVTLLDWRCAVPYIAGVFTGIRGLVQSSSRIMSLQRLAVVVSE